MRRHAYTSNSRTLRDYERSYDMGMFTGKTVIVTGGGKATLKDG